MKILIDDVRIYLPNGDRPDIIASSYTSGMYLLSLLARDGELPRHHLFLDHDLGEADEAQTGYKIISIIEEQALGYGDYTWRPFSITCVSDNGAGRQRIQQVIDKLYGRS